MNNTIGPYLDGLGNPKVCDSIIVYADIMGYSEAVSEATHCGDISGRLKYIYRVVRDAIEATKKLNQIECVMKVISDTVIMAFPMTMNGPDAPSWSDLREAYSAAGCFQRSMIRFGFPVRGGIGIGRIHVSDLMAFPLEETLREMKEAEKVANYPRIVLLGSAETRWQGIVGTQSQDNLVAAPLWVDQDGAKFVNYIEVPQHMFPGQLKNSVLGHKWLIEKRLKDPQTKQRVRQKYCWMANYHNDFCRLSVLYDTAEYRVTYVNGAHS
jgi:hypothetical protein